MAEPLSIKDAARRLGIKPKEVRKRIKRGELGVVVPPDGETAGAAARAVLPQAAPGMPPPSPTERPAPEAMSGARTDERDAQIRQLEDLVRTLRDEVGAQRRQVEQLQAQLSTQTGELSARKAEDEAARADEADGADTADDAAETDWSEYDAESEQLRKRMGRLQDLLTKLDVGDADEAPAEPPMPQTQPTQSAPPKPRRAPPAQAAGPAPASEPRAAAPAARESSAIEPPLGEALSRRRDALGISREALAAASGLSWGFITEVERGRRRDSRSRERLSEAIEALGKKQRG